MSNVTVQVDWSLIGATLANCNAEEQAQFLKAFVKECNSWGSHYQVESQLASVNLALTVEERETLSMLSYQGE